jgi:hypothetical protein
MHGSAKSMRGVREAAPYGPLKRILDCLSCKGMNVGVYANVGGDVLGAPRELGYVYP